MAKLGAIGIDVGGTKTRFALFDKNFRVIEEIKVKTLDSQNTEEFTAVLAKSLDTLMKKSLKADLRVESVGVGCAGTLNADGSIKESLNIPFLKGFEFRSFIARQSGNNVFVTNDVTAGLYGEHQLGAAIGRNHVIGIFIGTGIGGALMFDGKLYRGSNATAGDIGHYVLHPFGTNGDSGHRQVLNEISSRTAIAGEAAKLAAKNQAPNLLRAVGKNIANITSGDLAMAISEGDEQVEKLVRERCHILGIALSNIVDFLNPEMVVLGGGLTEKMPVLVRDEVDGGIRANSNRDSKRSLEVVVAKLKGHAVTTGAAKLAVDISLSL